VVIVIQRRALQALALIPAIACVLSGCSGCPKPNPIALIHYSQLGACIKAQTGNGLVTVPSSHAIVIFRVSTIDSTKTVDNWSFDSTSLVISPPSQIQQNLGGTGPVSIGANTTVAVTHRSVSSSKLAMPMAQTRRPLIISWCTPRSLRFPEHWG
jgi:hypothetical protein